LRQVSTVISAPTGEAENFFKEFKFITNATGSSKWNKNYFLFNFISKGLFYVKNNSSKYELKLSAALGVPSMDYGDM
jgi:hypothetical protein